MCSARWSGIKARHCASDEESSLKTLIRSLLIISAGASVLLGSNVVFAHKRQYVQINDVADSALCRETAQAVAQLRADIGWPMTKLYGRGEGHSDRTVGQLTFHGLRVQSIVFANSAGEKRTLPLAFYLVDIDNTPPVEMIDFVTGGHMATGEGTTLSVLKNNLSAAPEPVPDQALRNAALKIGPLDVRFTGKDFDVGYFSYPFGFAGRNYLFIEGNGGEYQAPEGQLWDVHAARKLARDAVLEIVPPAGLVTRCYFPEDAPAK
jgi:hypothetical protein